MKCLMHNCGGNTDPSVSRSIRTSDGDQLMLYPCEKCGLLHYKINGMPLFDQEADSLVYLKDRRVVDEHGNPFDLSKAIGR